MAARFEAALGAEPELTGLARRIIAAWRLIADCREPWGGGIDWTRAQGVLALYHVRLTGLMHYLLRAVHGYLSAEAEREGSHD